MVGKCMTIKQYGTTVIYELFMTTVKLLIKMLQHKTTLPLFVKED